MDFRILGHLEIISSDGDPLRIAKPRVRALLSVLLLRAGRPCSHGISCHGSLLLPSACTPTGPVGHWAGTASV